MVFKVLSFGVLLQCFAINCSPLPQQETPKSDPSIGKTCTRPVCVKSAAQIIRNLDQSVDPCDDFYNFACGSFIKNNVIEDHRGSVDQFMLVSDEINNKLRKVLERPHQENEIRPFQLVRDLYQSCLDEDRIEELGLDDTKQLIHSLGGWPVLEDQWDDSNFTWFETIYKFRNHGLGINYLFNFAIKINIQNSTQRIISIDQPGLGLDRKHLVKGLDNPEVEAYYEYMVNIARALGAEEKRAKEELLESLKFEILLANMSSPVEERRMPLTLSSPVWYAEQRFPEIPWLEYINKILSPVCEIDDNEIISVRSLDYTKNVTELLKKTPNRVVANYLYRRAVASTIRYLPEKIKKYQHEFTQKYLGVNMKVPRWEECVEVVSRSLPVVMGAIYVRNYFSEEGRAEARQMVDNIIKQFITELDDLEWMDAETRINAKNKSNSTIILMAYPDELLDDKVLVEYFEGLHLDPREYRQNAMNLTLFMANKRIAKLREPVLRIDWVAQGGAATVNSFYNYGKNVIEFPAGILQGVFFNKDRPKYLNYGAIGYAIGHEITHGFDDTGRRVNADGNLVNWWDNTTAMKFLDRAMCFIDQYGRIEVPEVNLTLNGITSQGEIIADNGGIKSSYRAYLKWEKEYGAEPLLPGLPYNGRQLFWISYANAGCEKYRLKALKHRVLSSYHPPYRYRVNGAVANSDDFAKDFSCPIGSKMSVKKKCSIW